MREYMQRVLKMPGVSAAVQFFGEHRQRILKIAGISAAILFVLVAGLVMYLKSLDFNDYKPQIQAAVQEATGRTLAIDGEIKLSISFHPALEIDGVHLSNAAGGSRANMVDVERLELELSMWSLLAGNVYVERLILVRPDVLLETLSDGTANWVFASETPDGEAPAEVAEMTDEAQSAAVLPQVHRMLITEAKLVYRDGKTGETLSVNLPEVQLWEDDDEALHVSANGQFNNIPLSVDGKLGSFDALADNEKLDVDLHTAVAGVDMQLTGSVDKPLDGKGIALGIDVNAPDMAGLAKLADVQLGTFALHLKAMLSDSENGYDLSDLQLNMGESDMTGNIQLALIQPRPRINAVFQSKRFSLDDILPKSQEGAAKAPAKDEKANKSGKKEEAKRVFPSEPVDVKAMKSVDADITYKADLFVMSGMQMTDMDVGVQLADGVLKVVPFKARLGGGTLNGKVALRGNKLPASLDISLTGRKIGAGRLLGQMGATGDDGKSLMEGGSVNLDVSFKGTGKSVAAIMGGSNGRIKLQMGEGKLKGNALGMVGGDVVMGLVDKLNPFAESKDYTALQCGVVHFRVENGLMVSEDGIAIETDSMNILSDGEINLQDETIDLSIGTEPRSGMGMNVSNMANVVRLGGTLAEPGIRMDVAKSGKVVARVAGALATGGLSLLGEGLINRAIADSSPCKTALEMK